MKFNLFLKKILDSNPGSESDLNPKLLPKLDPDLYKNFGSTTLDKNLKLFSFYRTTLPRLIFALASISIQSVSVSHVRVQFHFLPVHFRVSVHVNARLHTHRSAHVHC